MEWSSRQEHKSAFFLAGTLSEKYTIDFLRLTFSSDKSQNTSKTSLILWQFFMSAFPNNTWSSVKNKCEKAGPPHKAFTRFHNFESHLSLMRNPRTSMHMINTLGDKGLPCLIPLVGLNSSNAPPLNNIVILEDVIQLFITLSKKLGT